MVKFWEGKRASWPGGDVAEAVTLPKPAVKSERLEPKPAPSSRDGFLAEYATLAKAVGIPVPDAAIEEFKDFLRRQDWGIFALTDVIAYMDKKAAAESKEKSGWRWRPLRDGDHLSDVRFGSEASNRGGGTIIPASDWYIGKRKGRTTYVFENNGGHREIFDETQYTPSPINVYDKTIPLHALRKVAAIESGFKAAQVHFFVCDYALAPEIQYPDPFLMAVIANPKLNIGVGRFIIDFWDEPGFGFDNGMLGQSGTTKR